MSDAKDDPEYPYDREAEQKETRAADSRPAGSDDVNRATCGHMVQSNSTCGDSSCPNYGCN